MIGQQFTCELYPDDVLTVVKMYNTKQGVVHANKRDTNIVFSTSGFEEPHLSLAHIGKQQRLMKKKEEHLW